MKQEQKMNIGSGKESLTKQEEFAPGPVRENTGEHDTAISRNIKVKTTSSSGKVIKVKSDSSRLVPYIKL